MLGLCGQSTGTGKQVRLGLKSRNRIVLMRLNSNEANSGHDLALLSVRSITILNTKIHKTVDCKVNMI